MSGPDYVFTSSSSKTEVLFAQYYDHILTKVNFRKPPRCSAILPISKNRIRSYYTLKFQNEQLK